MKIIYFLLIIFCTSCQNGKNENDIVLIGVKSSLQTNDVSFEISSTENFAAINEALTFGFECVANEKDFEESIDEELNKKKINDFIKLKKVRKNTYIFSVDKNIYEEMLTKKCIYCRFTRPDFLFSKSYKSGVFKIR